MTDHLAVKTLDGTIATYGDLVSERAAWAAVQQTEGAAALSPVETFITGLGGTVTYSEDESFMLLADVDPADLSAIVARTDVLWVRAQATRPEPDAGYSVPTYAGPRSDGHQSADQSQLSWFFANGFTGDADGELLAHGEGADCIFEDHVGFLDVEGNPRMQTCWGVGDTCAYGTSTCPSGYASAAVGGGGAHATLSAGMLLGSIVDGTDPNVACAGTDCESRSWAARDAHGVYMDLDDRGRYRRVIMNSNGDTTLDDIKIYSQSVSQSRGADRTDPPSTWRTDCAEHDSSSARVGHDTLFRHGVAQFVSDGNRGHGPAVGCQATFPGTALGTFSVGGAWVESVSEASQRMLGMGATPADTIDVVNASASRGGTNYGRTVKDMAVAGGRVQYGYTETDPALVGAPSTSSYHNYGGSSGAAPYLAGFAAVFRAWWLSERGNRLIDDPGILYANLLLMGDRTDETLRSTSSGAPSTVDVGFSDVTGAGLFRGRAWNKAGLDGPAYWETGRLCVVRGVTSSFPLVGGRTLDPAVDELTFVAWMFDAGQSRHPDGEFAEVHLTVSEASDEPDSAGGTVTLETTDDGTDTKKRVVHHIGAETSPGSGYFGQRQLWAHLSVHLPAQTASVCGDNGILVHYAYLTEEDARDDDTDLSTYVRPPR